MGLIEHRAASPVASAIRVAVISVSDSRTIETDEGGALVRDLTIGAGFSVVARDIIPDEPARLSARVRELVGDAAAFEGVSRHRRVATDDLNAPPGPDVILVTGGTGVAPRDITVDTIAPLLDRRLDGFGELFRGLSFAEIGPAAMLSRACAGLIAGVAIFLIPGSPAAIRLALGRLILPELGHLIAETRRESATSAASTAATDGKPHRHDPQGNDHDHDRRHRP